MRLIDADALKQHIDKLPALPDGNFAGNHSALKALINMQPTIEPSAQPDLLDDGTLMMTVPQGILENVKRVMVDEVGTKFCKVMYPDDLEFFEWCTGCKEYDQEAHCCHRFTKTIQQTVAELEKQEERKKGQWIIDKDCEGKSRTVTCNRCGHKEFNWNNPNYCENCGAEMEGEDK